MNRLSSLLIFIIIAGLLPLYFHAQIPAKKRVTLYHKSTTVNGVTTPGTGKSIIYNQYDDFDVVEKLEQFGIEDAGFMIPTDNILAYKDANRSDVSYTSSMRERQNDGRIAVSYKGKSYLFTTVPTQTIQSANSPTTSTLTSPKSTLDYTKPSQNTTSLQIPPRLKQFIEAKNGPEVRLYAYNNHNFSFPLYGVKITTTYNGRTVTDVPQNVTCYYLGDSDNVVMLIGESFTGVYEAIGTTIKEYDVYRQYPYPGGENYLYIGKNNNQDKVILQTETKTNSGNVRKIRAEWSTNKAASNNTQAINSSGNNYYMPSAPTQSGSSSATTSTRRTCPACHGTGKGTDRIVYQPDYTGKQAYTYCSKCGKSGPPHTHNEPMCRTCYGRGYIE